MSSNLTKQDSTQDQAPLGRLLLEGFRWFDRSLTMSLAEAGLPALTAAQSLVFPNLDRGGTSISELSRRLGVTRQAAHQTVRELVKKGLLDIAVDPADARAQLVTLSDSGAKSVAVAIGMFDQIEKRLAGRIGDDELTALRSALEQDWGEPIVLK